MEDFNIGGAKMAVECADLTEYSWEVNDTIVRYKKADLCCISISFYFVIPPPPPPKELIERYEMN